VDAAEDEDGGAFDGAAVDGERGLPRGAREDEAAILPRLRWEWERPGELGPRSGFQLDEWWAEVGVIRIRAKREGEGRGSGSGVRVRVVVMIVVVTGGDVDGTGDRAGGGEPKEGAAGGERTKDVLAHLLTRNRR
jgi:hypothetical protein